MAKGRAIALLLLGGIAYLGYRYYEAGATFEAVVPEEVSIEFLVRFDEMDDPPDPSEVHFTIANDGQPFLLVRDSFIALSHREGFPATRIQVPGLVGVEDVAWMHDGALLMVVHDALGELGEEGFQRIQALPEKGMQIEPATRGECYLFRGATADQARNLYLYRRGGGRLHLLKTDLPIRDVQGDGTLTHVAIGEGIYRLEPGAPMALVLEADEEIVSIAAGPSSSLFYSTAGQVGFVQATGEGFVFLDGAGGELRAHGEDLYLFMPARGVLQIRPISAFGAMASDLASGEKGGS